MPAMFSTSFSLLFPWSDRGFVADQVTISLHAQPPPSSACCSTRLRPTTPLCLAYPSRTGIAYRSNPFPAPHHGRSYRGLPAHARFCLPLLLDFAQLATTPGGVAGLDTKQGESGGVFFLKRYNLSVHVIEQIFLKSVTMFERWNEHSPLLVHMAEKWWSIWLLPIVNSLVTWR